MRLFRKRQEKDSDCKKQSGHTTSLHMPSVRLGHCHEKLAQELKAARERAGISQRKLAAKLGTNQTQVSMMESGDQFVRVIDLIAWCDVLGADALEILGRAKD